MNSDDIGLTSSIQFTLPPTPVAKLHPNCHRPTVRRMTMRMGHLKRTASRFVLESIRKHWKAFRIVSDFVITWLNIWTFTGPSCQILPGPFNPISSIYHAIPCQQNCVRIAPGGWQQCEDVRGLPADFSSAACYSMYQHVFPLLDFVMAGQCRSKSYIIKYNKYL